MLLRGSPSPGVQAVVLFRTLDGVAGDVGVVLNRSEHPVLTGVNTAREVLDVSIYSRLGSTIHESLTHAAVLYPTH